MNSTFKTAAMITEEFRQLNENSDTKQEGIQHTKARSGRSLKTKCGHCTHTLESTDVKVQKM